MWTKTAEHVSEWLANKITRRPAWTKTVRQASERPLRHGICETVKVLSFSSKLPNREHTVQDTPGLCPCVPGTVFLKTTLLKILNIGGVVSRSSNIWGCGFTVVKYLGVWFHGRSSHTWSVLLLVWFSYWFAYMDHLAVSQLSSYF